MHAIPSEEIVRSTIENARFTFILKYDCEPDLLMISPKIYNLIPSKWIRESAQCRASMDSAAGRTYTNKTYYFWFMRNTPPAAFVGRPGWSGTIHTIPMPESSLGVLNITIECNMPPGATLRIDDDYKEHRLTKCEVAHLRYNQPTIPQKIHDMVSEQHFRVLTTCYEQTLVDPPTYPTSAKEVAELLK